MTSHQSRPIKSGGNKSVDGIRNLKVQHALSDRVQVGTVLLFYQPDNQRSNHVEQMRTGKSEQRAQVNADGPLTFGGVGPSGRPGPTAAGRRAAATAESPSAQICNISSFGLKPILFVAG